MNQVCRLLIVAAWRLAIVLMMNTSGTAKDYVDLELVLAVDVSRSMDQGPKKYDYLAEEKRLRQYLNERQDW